MDNMTMGIFSALLTIGFSLLAFLLKTQFNDIKTSIKEGNQKTNERITKLEEKTNKEIANIKENIADIRGEFATTFVLREDFFRAMNGVEDKVVNIDKKIDQIILNMKGN